MTGTSHKRQRRHLRARFSDHSKRFREPKVLQIDDPKLAEDLSRLVGEHDVPVGSRTRDGSGISSWQTSTQRRRILEPAQIRAIERGHALLFATGIPAAMIRLLPWYTGPHAAQLERDNTAATESITRRARSDYTGGPR